MKWLSVAEAAELAGVSYVQMWRRIKKLEQDDPRVVRRIPPALRNREVNPRAIKRLLEDGSVSPEIDEIARRLVVVENRCNAHGRILRKQGEKLDALARKLEEIERKAGG